MMDALSTLPEKKNSERSVSYLYLLYQVTVESTFENGEPYPGSWVTEE